MPLELAAPSSPATTATAMHGRVMRAKRAYTTRHVPLAAMCRLFDDPKQAPRTGDLLLARVHRVGKHATLEGTDGRRSALFPGDEIVVVYGARYAPDQFEAHVPDNLAACHLAAGGGVAALVTERHGAVAAPTELTPLGLLADAGGRRLNLADHRHSVIGRTASGQARPLTIASLGTSMNAGKTTSAAYLVRGLMRAGLRVGAAKITGTGSGNDPGLLRDAGAELVLDFTDLGHASTAGLGLNDLLDIMKRVQASMAVQGVQALVMEVADGLLQRETSMLLRSPHYAQAVDANLFSSSDAMGAVAGVRWLHDQGLPVLALAGTLTRSPLSRREAAAATRLPVLGLDELGDPDTARRLFESVASCRTAA
jgi:hypothetical protein